jgi:hypothetical protein
VETKSEPQEPTEDKPEDMAAAQGKDQADEEERQKLIAALVGFLLESKNFE